MTDKLTKMTKGPIRFILIFFLIAISIRVFDSLVLRTDESVIGELFTHKLFGILMMGIALYLLKLKWRDIGFAAPRFGRGILIGLCIGIPAYAIAYAAEYMATGNASLQFYTTSYNVTGNTIMEAGVLFVAICIAGNIVNVIMEDGVFRGLFLKIAESKYSFARSMLFSSALFGIWHGIMPLRNFLTGEQSPMGASMSALLLVLTSFVFGVALCLLCRLEGSLWAGMTVHFINNASVNLLHITGSGGIDALQTMRISIAQTLLFVGIIIWWAVKRRNGKKEKHIK
jgi:membrane protease YdiL (CAAX protease family)